MKPNAKHVRTIAFALLLAAGAGCGQSVNLVSFNDQIAQSNKKLAQETWAFRQVIFPLSEDKAVKIDKDGAAYEVRAAYEKLLKTVKEIREERKKVKVPKVESAEALHKAYDDYLKGVELIVTQEFAKIVQLAEVRGLQSSAKWTKIQTVFFEIQRRDNDAMQELQASHQKFAEAVSMKLVQAY